MARDVLPMFVWMHSEVSAAIYTSTLNANGERSSFLLVVNVMSSEQKWGNGQGGFTFFLTSSFSTSDELHLEPSAIGYI